MHPSSRAAAKRATREALIEAGIAEFGERGLDAPSLDAICARAGFTRGAFYVHFRDREDFVAAVMEAVLGALLDAVISTGDGEHDLERTIGRFAELLAWRQTEAPDAAMRFHRVLEACARSEGVGARFAGLLREAIERVSKAAAAGQAGGAVRADVGAEALAALLVALALGAVTAVDAGLRFDPREVAATARRLCGA